jgi:adenylate cyclase
VISVRLKLVALVLGSVLPAVVGAVLSERASERELLQQVERRVDGANRRFEAAIEENQKNSRLALSFAAQSPWFQKALEGGDQERVARFVNQLASVYKYRIIVAADHAGRILAAGNAERGPASLDRTASEAFGDLLEGKPLEGLIGVQLKDGLTYSLVAATPIFNEEKKQVGALALLSPMTARYLEYLEKTLNADLALSVNDRLVAATAGHTAPELRSDSETSHIIEQGKKLYAVKTFHPEDLQREGLHVELTASRDVTELHATAQANLRKHLLILGGFTLVVLAIALRFAARLAQSVKGITTAAAQVKTGNYMTAPLLKTGDELELLTSHFNDMVEGLKERDRLKETFGRYVTRQVADHLMKGHQDLGGELVPVTVLFSDIRSFTSISERMDPRALLDFLNEYFAGMVESVLSHQGVVDKFIGDAIMAVFGAPVPEPEDPLRAVKAALEMRARLERINEGFRARGLPEIKTGIGLHSGQVVAGNMGHSERMEYTVIGDPVNLASRLEGMTKELGCDVLLSEDLYLLVKDEVEAEPLKKIRVKGRDQEVMVYRLVGLREKQNAAE